MEVPGTSPGSAEKRQDGDAGDRQDRTAEPASGDRNDGKVEGRSRLW